METLKGNSEEGDSEGNKAGDEWDFVEGPYSHKPPILETEMKIEEVKGLDGEYNALKQEVLKSPLGRLALSFALEAIKDARQTIVNKSAGISRGYDVEA